MSENAMKKTSREKEIHGSGKKTNVRRNSKELFILVNVARPSTAHEP